VGKYEIEFDIVKIHRSETQKNNAERDGFKDRIEKLQRSGGEHTEEIATLEAKIHGINQAQAWTDYYCNINNEPDPYGDRIKYWATRKSELLWEVNQKEREIAELNPNMTELELQQAAIDACKAAHKQLLAEFE
jgi:chromosome segregation ATPase